MLNSKLSREPSVTGKTAESSSRGEQQGRAAPAPAPATGSTSRVRGAQVSSSRSGEQQSRLW